METVEAPPTVLVASNDAFELATLSASLRLNSVNVVGEASSSAIADNLFRFLTPSVFLVDLQFSGIDALALIVKFRKINPGLGVVLMTACPDLRLMGLTHDQIPVGAQIVLKKTVADLSVVSFAISHSLTAAHEKSKSSWVDNHGSLHESAFETALSEFTNIQMETLRLLAKGLSNAEIAKARFVSEKSVEQIVARIAQNFHIEQDHTHNLRVLITGEYFKWLGALNRQ